MTETACFFDGKIVPLPRLQKTSASVAAALPGPVVPTLPEPRPLLQIRVRAVIALDDGMPLPYTMEQARERVAALVEHANLDFQGSGIRLVCFPRSDVEVRQDSTLRRNVALTQAEIQQFQNGKLDEAKGQKVIDAATEVSRVHRQLLAEEQPDKMLWLFTRPNEVRKTLRGGKFFRWHYIDDRGGSQSGGSWAYVQMHADFLSTLENARDDASRAAHEVGHYLNLPHTHREPYHELANVLTPAQLAGTPQERLDAWRTAVGTWLKTELPDNTSAKKAREHYDNDRSLGILDTAADPGGGVIALANQVAGHGHDAYGPVTSVSVNVPGITTPVVLTAPRSNVMSYYLDKNIDEPMHFSPGQVAVMRQHLMLNRKALVASQLGPKVPVFQIGALSPEGA